MVLSRVGRFVSYLFCIVLNYGIVLYCIALYFVLLYFILLYCIVITLLSHEYATSIYVQIGNIGNVIAWICNFSMFAEELVCDKRRQK